METAQQARSVPFASADRWDGVPRLRFAAVGAALAVMFTGGAVQAADQPSPVTPYFAPPFRHDCTVHHFKEGQAPDLNAYPDDPLCVEYAKRDITADNGGAVRFLLAEPARFAIAIPKCQYWQQDHWSVQLSRGDTPVVQWDGSYWFDKVAGAAAARLRHFAVEGQPATFRQAAKTVRPYSAELASYFMQYGSNGSGGGYAGSGPWDPRCTG